MKLVLFILLVFALVWIYVEQGRINNLESCIYTGKPTAGHACKVTK